MKLKLILILYIILLCTPSLLAKKLEENTNSNHKSINLDHKSTNLDHKSRDFHWFILPFFSSIPGIGSTTIIMGEADNIYKHLKISGLYSLNPKIQKQTISLSSIPLYKNWESSFSIKRNIISSLFYERSMTSDPKDYYQVQRKTNSFFVGISHILWDDQIILSSKIYYNDSKINNFFNTNEKKLDNSFTHTGVSKKLSFMATLNLVNSDLNPTKGWHADLLFEPTLSNNDVNEPNFSVITENVTAYLPVFSKDTIVFNVFNSDSLLYRQGLTDIDKLRKQYSLNCNPTSSNYAECLHIENARIRNLVAYHKHGDAFSLGGETRLRAYPKNRFSGAHSLFQGIEYRSNFSFWKIKMFQTALFIERGMVSDSHVSLFKHYRNSYGFGFRGLLYSVLYRLDFAVIPFTMSDDAATLSISITSGYPMQINDSDI